MKKQIASGKSVALWISIGVPLSMIVALALGLISLLNFFVYQKTYKDLNIARLGVVARDLRESIENGLSLALSPQANTELASTVSALQGSTEGLRFVVIIDEKGKRIAESGDAAAEQNWLKHIQAGAWNGEDRMSYQVGLPFRNSFGVVIGAVIVGYDKAALVAAMTDMRHALMIDWARAVGVIAVTLMLGIWILTRRLRADLAHAEEALSSTFDHPPTRLSLPSLGPELEQSLLEFMQKMRTLADEISRSLKGVSRR